VTEKRIWESKTFWANAIALAAVVLCEYAGIPLSEEQIALLATVNILLRIFTKEPER
jgi:hypothetical protein